MQTIDAINVKFKKDVDADIISKTAENQLALKATIWNKTETIKREPQYNGYSINYVHGHTGKQGYYESKKHIINLNNELGQLPQFGDNKGDYGIVYSFPTVDKVLSEIENVESSKNIQKEYEKLKQGQINEVTFKKNIANDLNNELTNYPAKGDQIYLLSLVLLVEPIHRKLLLDIITNDTYQQILKQYILKYSKDPIDDASFKAEVFKIIQNELAKSPDNKDLKEKLVKIIEDAVVEDKYQQPFKTLKKLNPTMYEEIFSLYMKKLKAPPMDDPNDTYQQILKQYILKYSKDPIDDASFKAEVFKIIQNEFAKSPDNKDLKDKLVKIIEDAVVEEKYQQPFKTLKELNPTMYKKIFSLYMKKLEVPPMDDPTFKDESLEVLVRYRAKYNKFHKVVNSEEQKQIRKLSLDFIRDEHTEFKDALEEILNKVEQFDNALDYDFKVDDDEYKRLSFATKLFDSIITNYQSRCNDGDKLFQHKCMKAIENAKKELEQHRHLMPLLVNLLAIITILPAIIMKLSTGQFEIKRTDSSIKVQNLKEKLQELKFTKVDESNGDSLNRHSGPLKSN